MRAFWLIGGLASVVLGLIGVLLPVMPTVPFMLLAAFCFARSSPRLDAWLSGHPVFGPHVRAWREKGAAPRRAKKLAIFGMSTGFVFSALVGLPPLALAGQAAVMITVGIWLWRRPEP